MLKRQHLWVMKMLRWTLGSEFFFLYIFLAKILRFGGIMIIILHSVNQKLKIKKCPYIWNIICTPCKLQPKFLTMLFQSVLFWAFTRKWKWGTTLLALLVNLKPTFLTMMFQMFYAEVLKESEKQFPGTYYFLQCMLMKMRNSSSQWVSADLWFIIIIVIYSWTL